MDSKFGHDIIKEEFKKDIVVSSLNANHDCEGISMYTMNINYMLIVCKEISLQMTDLMTMNFLAPYLEG